MKKVNLRDFYPDYYKNDYVIDVPDEVLKAMEDADKAERAYNRRVYYHKAQYSLDRGDGIENEAALVALSPHELYERKLAAQELYEALSKLPVKQAQRVYERYILEQKVKTIAERNGVRSMSIIDSVHRGLANLKKILENFQE